MRKIVSSVCAAILSMTSIVTVAPVSAAPFKPVEMERQATNVEQIGHRHGYYRYRGHPYYNGHRGYRVHRHGYRRYNDWWFPPAAFVTGAIIGSTLAAPRAPAYREPIYRAYGQGDAHVEWCHSRYRSYRAYDNTFQPYHGPRRQCYSPFSQ